MDFKMKLFKHKGKTITYEDLIAKIYDNSEEKNDQIAKIVNHLKDVIQNSADASVIAPWIAEYLRTSVTNDDNLVKLARIIAQSMKEQKAANQEISFGIPQNLKDEWLREANIDIEDGKSN